MRDDIVSHENSFPEYNSNEQKLEKLKAEYQVILETACRFVLKSMVGIKQDTRDGRMQGYEDRTFDGYSYGIAAE